MTIVHSSYLAAEDSWADHCRTSKLDWSDTVVGGLVIATAPQA